jgi:L-2-hydroxycarboxylate dehydrogenase (NAD+)
MIRTEAELTALAERLLAGAGVPAADARRQAAHLVAAELCGHPSHGLQRLPRLLERIAAGLARPGARGRHVWRREALLEVDGERGLGPVVVAAAVEALRERLPRTGVAAAAVRNANHIGMLAPYVEDAARTGLVAVVLSTSEALVHPYGGTRAMLGTNPVAVGLPTAGEPFVLDLATSTVSMGKIHNLARRGAPLAPGWAVDAAGRPTTDAAAARDGAIAPFGGAKGYGLGLAIELFVAALTGADLAPDIRGTLDAAAPANKGDVVVLAEPAAQPGLADRLAAYLDAVRRSPAADPARPVAVPGDGARARRAAARRGGVDVPEALLAELEALEAA